MVGNKCEELKNREVLFKEGKELANKFGIKFYEASYKTGKNIDNIFLYPANEIIERGNAIIK